MLASVIITVLAILFIGYMTKRFFNSNVVLQLEQSKAQIKALESEIKQIMRDRHLKLKEERHNFDKSMQKERSILETEYKNKLYEIDRLEKELEHKIDHHLQEAKIHKDNAEKEYLKLVRLTYEQEKVMKDYEEAKLQAQDVLQNYTSLDINEAKKMLLNELEDELEREKALMIRRAEIAAREESRAKANYIIAQATTRFASEYVNERLVNVVNIPNDELKGRIIGKDGRNIRSLELITGVDFIIDDTPNTILLSSFNTYRRAMATRTLEELVLDGRIHPARIEEVYERVKTRMDEEILKEGEEVVLDMGLGYMDPELKRLVGKLKYRASFGQNALAHSIEVAYLAGIIAGELNGDEKLARRAGLLHDIGKSLTQERGGNHVDLGAEICTHYKEHPIVINAILAHHGNEESKSIECSAVCTADVLSAARPGARMEVLEGFLSRMQDLEKIAMNKFGVKQAYAIHAGRELRVIVRADLVDDLCATTLSRDIASEIEKTLQYPGEIKVSVIRETRAVEYAKQ
ncbi:ribonuclease Y [Helicobacter sp. 13S00401-1]|uniref:ribonuclease Y n=1 Tax=Helicobacter sp. 13S00401-1 TaxID=1905758 RepID=UPI000BD7EEC2|nr:ribonuclease Y [Helicobacter sp. 13S00401-1]PAF49306.1 ribonuclease Y [Helicobacter sp. 13S00401-1]